MKQKKHWSRAKRVTNVSFSIFLCQGFSWKFHVISCHKSTAVWSQLTPNTMTIPCHLSRFYFFTMLEHDMDFTEVQVMEFQWYERENDGITLWIWCHFRPSCRQRDMRKSVSHFLQGCYGFFLHFQFPLSNGI